MNNIVNPELYLNLRLSGEISKKSVRTLSSALPEFHIYMCDDASRVAHMWLHIIAREQLANGTFDEATFAARAAYARGVRPNRVWRAFEIVSTHGNFSSVSVTPCH